MANQNAKNKNNKKVNNKGVQNKKTNNTKVPAKKTDTKKVTKEVEIKKTTVVKEEVKVKETTPSVSEKVIKEKKNFSLTSKQKDLILVLLVVVLLVVALFVTMRKEEKPDIELPIALEGTAGFTEITYSEYEEKMNTEAPFLVVIVRDGCGYCEMYEPVVEEVANEYKLPIYYINMSNLSSEEYTALGTSNSFFRKNQGNWGTPTTLFMYGDYVVDTITQYVEKDTLVSFVKENFKVEA